MWSSKLLTVPMEGFSLVAALSNKPPEVFSSASATYSRCISPIILGLRKLELSDIMQAKDCYKNDHIKERLSSLQYSAWYYTLDFTRQNNRPLHIILQKFKVDVPDLSKVFYTSPFMPKKWNKHLLYILQIMNTKCTLTKTSERYWHFCFMGKQNKSKL